MSYYDYTMKLLGFDIRSLDIIQTENTAYSNNTL
jgi:hypothetical protein